ncbi:type II toxin-antitoxin system RelE/ParE family toxin [Breznakiellaceae bacterium SP9]
MRLFKTKEFTRLADKAKISDADLMSAATEVNKGEYEADLGGDVYKKRIARAGVGKSGGYRVILFFRQDERLFFDYMFAKSSRANIDEDELKEFKKKAKVSLEYTDEQIKERIKKGRFKELDQ